MATRPSSHVVTFAALLAVPFGAAQWTVTRLHPAGASHSEAWSVADGQQVGRAMFSGRWHAALWRGSPESFVDLHPSGAAGSRATAVSNDQQVGYVEYPHVFDAHAALWTGNATSLVILEPPGATYSYATGVWNGRQWGFVGISGQGQFPVLWDGVAESAVDLLPDWGRSAQTGRFSQGWQAGNVGFGGRTHAVIWNGSAESAIDLHPEVASSSEAYAVSGEQQVGWAIVDEVQHASLWSGSPQSWVDLHPAWAERSYALGVCAGQQVGYAVAASEIRACLWSGNADSLIDLHEYVPPEYRGSTAQAIWYDLTSCYVVGSGFIGGGFHALLWTHPRACPADLTGDRQVDLSDLAILLSHLGPSCGSRPCNAAEGDIDVDGDVDVVDLTTILSRFGEICP